MTTEAIKIGIDDKVLELKGEALAEFNEARKAAQAEYAAQAAAIEAKGTARASALAKLAELGLTQEEIAAL